MPSLLLVVFILQFVIYIVNSVGATAVSELVGPPTAHGTPQAYSLQAWALYNKLPTPTSDGVEKSTRQRKEALRLKKELASISAQDDFARWAKLRRQHDKADADYNKTCMRLPGAWVP